MAHSTNSAELRKLTRTQLQSLAKVGTSAPACAPCLVDTNEHVWQREGVRAVGKTEDIIHRLVEKHTRGVPIPEYVLPASSDTSPCPHQTESGSQGR